MVCEFLTKIRKFLLLKFQEKMIKIFTTDIFNNSLKKGIIKSDVSDHFPIFFSIRLTKEKLQEGVIKIKKEFSASVT